MLEFLIPSLYYLENTKILRLLYLLDFFKFSATHTMLCLTKTLVELEIQKLLLLLVLLFEGD
jgi:hypothetical protein